MQTRQIWAIAPEALQAILSRCRALSQLQVSDARIEQASKPRAAAPTIDDAARVGYPVQRRGDTAIVSLSGLMMKNPGWFETVFLGATSTSEVTAMVSLAAADDTVKNILLLVDSPGGEVDGIAELEDALAAAKAEKPVVAFANGTAASGGYWAASQGNKLFTDRLGAVGSIGVFMVLYDTSAMYEEAGVKAILLTTGDYKGAGADGVEVTPEQVAEFQSYVDTYYAAFTGAVARGRGMAPGDVKKVADGRMFIGPDAKAAGLVDNIQSLSMTLGNIDQGRGLRKRTNALREMELQATDLGIKTT